MLGASISRNSVLLALFAVATTATIAGTYLGTRDIVAENRRIAAQGALLEIVPPERHDNLMLDDTLTVHDPRLGLRQPGTAYIARLGDDPVAIILPVTARDGYTGDIDLIVGVNLDGSVAGVRVLAHRETPGLGDKIERRKSDWVEAFVGRALGDPEPERWTVRRDGGVFDQFTGATITPRAVAGAVRGALEYFEEHGETLLGQRPAPTPAEVPNG